MKILILTASLLFFPTVGEAQDSCARACTEPASWTPSAEDLKGSHEVQRRQNTQAQREGLTLIKNDRELAKLKKDGKLQRLPESSWLRVDPRLKEKWRWALPHVVPFIDNFAAFFYVWFGHPIQVNSAVRTVEYQRWLSRRNANAADVKGDEASSHLYGSTVDIAKRRMTKEELTFVRAVLIELKNAGRIAVAEEFNQAVFHVMVFRPDVQPEVASSSSAAPAPQE